MDETALVQRLADIQNQLEACLPTETEALSAQTEAHIQEAIEHVLRAQELPGQESRDETTTPSGVSHTTGAADAVSGGWISANVDSTVTLTEWQ